MTLIEVLVGLAVFGLLLAALAAMLHVTYGISIARMRASDAQAEATPALDFLEALIGDARPAEAVPGGAVLFAGAPDRLALVAPLGGGFTDAGGLQLIHLGLQGGVLRLAWSPYGDDALAVPRAAGGAALLPGVAKIRFRYFGRWPAGRAAAWRDSWDGIPILPSLVDVDLSEASGGHSELIVALPVTGIGRSNAR